MTGGATARWLVYLSSPSNSINGYTADFIKYGCPFATCGLPATGNGFLYASNPAGSGGGGGGGTSNPVLDTTGPNPPITSIPVKPVAVAPSPVTPVITPPASTPVAQQISDAGLPVTVERISIDPTPIITAFAFETSGVSQSFADAMNELPASEGAASHAAIGNDSEAPETSIDSDNRSLSVWDGMLTFSPELVRRLGLDERSLD